ncbi:3-oxoacyl-[acyl-carrier-protein] synthase, KASII [Paraburkholderia caribensis MBA4]|uniref:3-oxoacyl-[acyl-carrier-protein] synthase, KASII n=1 Tax=Paraburkholderia caribensis MBA4 TaxID=1323664 RepID=A0A0P0RGF5_9BURK|nr:3-oxoacyl-[acyl-carrier-protein] synthase, KASII [Paraburkholderia caribensis MBA4]
MRMGIEADQRATQAATHARILAGTLVRDISDELPWVAQRNVRTAALMPRGFNPGTRYPSRHHPSGLQMMVYAMADALASLGLPWQQICEHVKPDEISVYAGSSIGQVDAASMTSLVQQSTACGRVNARLLPLSFPDMPADFINGYMLHSIGQTGAALGACASFLYNLQRGVQDIQSGRARIAIIGGAEAPVEPPVLDGFASMGALATIDRLPVNADGSPDHRRACRPFGDSAGFVLGESAQVLILMADTLALEFGANVLGMVADVYVHADGAKKSITAPGIGNYVTMLKAASLARALLGDGAVRRICVHAHGTGTPLNCTTESRILESVSDLLDGARLTVTSIKHLVGHSLGVAAGDQIAVALGAWQYGWIPGINTIGELADHVNCRRLDVLTEPRETGDIDIAIVNAKGFGGNNASAVIVSPEATLGYLKERHGANTFATFRHRRESTLYRIADSDAKACRGEETIPFAVHHGREDHERVHIERGVVHVDGYALPITLPDGRALIDYLHGADGL